MVATVTADRPKNKIHPYKFSLWVSMASMIMLFAGLSSAYMVREAAGNWLEFNLPNTFFYSTIVLLLSSVALMYAQKAFKASNESRYKTLLVAGFVLGVVFLILQYMGWMDMFNRGIDLKGNPSGSFVYLISGVHALHIVGGIVILLIALYHAFSLPFEVTEKRKLRLELTNTYWHFVDLLWVYLVLLFILV